MVSQRGIGLGVLAVLALVTATGCGSSDSDVATGSATSSPSTPPVSTAMATDPMCAPLYVLLKTESGDGTSDDFPSAVADVVAAQAVAPSEIAAPLDEVLTLAQAQIDSEEGLPMPPQSYWDSLSTLNVWVDDNCNVSAEP